ncbi:MAG: hypothetical protein JO281_10220 [Pseudonocardiales bacterium]|nr:hypothetical protein [Pseudonocardiales bacterium]
MSVDAASDAATDKRQVALPLPRPRGTARHRQHWPTLQVNVTAALAIAACGVLGLVVPAGLARLLLLLMFMLFGPGAALLCHLRLPNLLIAWSLAVTTSMTTVAVVAAVTIWADIWHPLVAHVCLLALTVGSAATRILIDVRSGKWHKPLGPSDIPLPTEVDTASPLPPFMGRRLPAPSGVVDALPYGLLLASAAVWMVSLLGFDARSVGDYGLTAALGAPFIACIVLVCLAFAVELFTRVRTAVLISASVLFLVITRATASLLLELPEYAWTYKHFGVVAFFQQYGHVVNPGDIYQQWPMFFAAIAQLTSLAHVAPVSFATWSSLFFGLLDAFLLAAVVRVLSGRRRVIFLAVFLFGACSWPDTNYFSPQAFAFALSLGFYIIVLVWLRHSPDPTVRIHAPVLARVRARLVQGAVPVEPVRDWTRRWAVVAATWVFFAITSSHQLTPYLILCSLVAVTVLDLLRPQYLVIVLIAVAIAYLVPRFGPIAGEYQIFSGFNFLKNASGNAQDSWSTPGQAFSALAVRGMAFSIWCGTLLIAFLNRRQLGRDILPLVLGFTPFAIILAGNYGGEAIYRIYMFSLPWCALIIAVRWLALADGSRARIVGSTIVLTVATLLALQGLQGQFAVDRVPPNEVAAAEYLYAHARPGATIVLAAQNFPARFTANYGSFNAGQSGDPALLDEDKFRHVRFGPSSVPVVTQYALSFHGSDVYFVISQQMVVYSNYFGYLPHGSLEELKAALRASPRWRTFLDNGEVVIFKYRPTG